MAFLGALSLLGAATGEMQKRQAVTANEQFKQQMLQLREMQMQNALQRQSLAMGKAAHARNVQQEGEGALGTVMPGYGGGGDSPPADTAPGPQSEDEVGAPGDFGDVPVDDPQQLVQLGGQPGAPPPGMPPAGPQPGAGAPPGQPAPGQPPQQGAAPRPPQGPPAAQMANMQPQQPQMPPGMQPPGPDGRPSFAQQQPQQPQRGSQMASAGPGVPQGAVPGQGRPIPRPDEASSYQMPGQQPAQQQPQRVAQAGQPQQRQQQQAGFPTSPEDLQARLQAYRGPNGKPLSKEAYEWAFNHGLQQMQKMQQLRGAQKTEQVRDLQIKKLQQGEQPKKADESQAKAISEYRERPLPMYGKAGEQNRATMDRVLELNPNYDETKYWGKQTGARAEAGLKSKEEMSFITKDSGAVKSFNVLVPHLATLQNTVEALNKGYANVPTNYLREMRNYWLQQFGSELPTDFKGVRDIVGFELIKAITGGAQALGDREEIRAALDAANSPEALLSLINRYRELSSGQLRGLKKKYESQTGKEDFEERFLGDDTRKMFLEKDKSGEKPLSDDVIKGLEEGRPHRIKRGENIELWQLKDGKPVKVEQ